MQISGMCMMHLESRYLIMLGKAIIAASLRMVKLEVARVTQWSGMEQTKESCQLLATKSLRELR